MKNFIIMGGVLFLVCGIAAAGLAFVYRGTSQKIEEQKKIEQENAFKQVFPEADRFNPFEKFLFSVSMDNQDNFDKKIISSIKELFNNQNQTLSSKAVITIDKEGALWSVGDNETLYKVKKEGDKLNIYLSTNRWEAFRADTRIGDVLAFNAKGYGGPIATVLGVNQEKRITGIRIISHTETPGLGAKIKTDQFLDQYKGKSADELRLKKEDPASGKIDAITAATISSRAVTTAVREAIMALP